MNARLTPLGWVNLALLAALGVTLTALLWPHWRDNPDLSHGFFMPVIFVVLLAESRRGPRRHLPADARTAWPAIALIGLGLLAAATAGLYAVSVDWSHALVALALDAGFVCFLGAALVTFARGPGAPLAFNWSAVIAVLLWLLCAPIPPGSYTRLTLQLQFLVTENVLRTLHLLGIAAIREGNVITLARATVGVEEACSGIRSLVSCVFAGLFFSASLVHRRRDRAVLIVLAPLLALAMNFFRSLTLTLLANAGVDIGGTWHDLTGFAVLGVTAVLLGALAVFLARHTPIGPPAAEDRAHEPVTPLPPAGALPRILTAGLALTVALGVFFYVNTRPSARRDLPVPNLAAILPLHPAGWQVRTDSSIYEFTDALHTEHLAQRTYFRPLPGGAVEQLTVYVAYWRPGQATVSLVASHTPDACWPGSGWVAQPSPPHRSLAIDGHPLPLAESRFFTNHDFPQHVWFWHLYDGRSLLYRDPRSPVQLLRLALRYGFRHDGDQLFVRVSSNRDWSDLAGEPLLAEIFRGLRPLGL